MKLLMVSMNSIHFRRWTQQLHDSGHEVYWFDILDQGYIPSMSWMHQITGWKKGFLKKRGRTFIKKYLPWFYKALSKKYDTPVDIAFAKAIKEIHPDVVHSFVLYISCAPILSIMQKNPQIKWIYSAWGSDLYYYQNIPEYLIEIKRVLLRVDYLFTDCERDHKLALNYGFKGIFLGVFPGGGGYDVNYLKNFSEPLSARKTILVKGNQNRSGRALPVLKALEEIAGKLNSYQIIVYGAENPKVLRFRESDNLDIKIYGLLPHEEVLKLMGKSLIYIGNSNSDGMPNSLLEAIIMGAFPIQSNPGGATEEIVEHGVNGLLISNHDDDQEIKNLIVNAVHDVDMIRSAAGHNNKDVIVPGLERGHIKKRVQEAYNTVKIR